MTKEHKVLAGVAALFATFLALEWTAIAYLAGAGFGLYACRRIFTEAD